MTNSAVGCEDRCGDRPGEDSPVLFVIRHASFCLLMLGALVAAAQESPPAPDESAPPILAEPFATPRQLLRLFEIGESDFQAFRDGQPIGPDDQEALTKILYRMPQIGADEIARWQHTEVSWSSLRADPAGARAEFFVVSGRVRSQERQSLTPRLATLFDFDHYYQVAVELDGGQGTAVIFTRTIPRAWQDRAQLDERTRMAAMFVKLGDERGGQPTCVFVAPRAVWLPDRVQAELGVGPDQVLLSQLGMDCGLWDDVRDRQRLPIGAEERECFYALLSAVARAEAGELARRAAPAPLATLLQHPQQVQGTILQVTGRVRRITRVVVDEPDIRQRYGIDAYYQLDVMVHVGDQPIEVRDGAGGTTGPVYRESFPVTCCAVQLPASWEPLVGAAKVNRPVLMHGVFYKLWAYSNPLVTSYDARQRQLSPLFVVGAPQSWDAGAQSLFGPGTWVGLGFCGLLAAVWGVVWAMNRSDRKRADRKSLPPLDLD
jgi:hypothetical protein